MPGLVMSVVTHRQAAKLDVAGFYTIGEVARILGIENEAKVRRWVVGQTGTPAVVQRQYDCWIR